ncbi:MAG: hypothetical protein QOG53_3094 [Frankiales bacterium]|jgi:hypothetical protein|nr:hypothetical protein [Frankiales bacterium]
MDRSSTVTALLGIAGAAIPEIMRVIAALRSNTNPSVREFVASLLATGLGLGVLLFDTDTSSALQVAVLGAAFPQLFSSAVAAATSGPGPRRVRGSSHVQRRLVDYVAWRL